MPISSHTHLLFRYALSIRIEILMLIGKGGPGVIVLRLNIRYIQVNIERRVVLTNRQMSMHCCSREIDKVLLLTMQILLDEFAHLHQMK